MLEPHSFVTAGDIEADGGRRDAGLGRDDAADRHAIAEMAIGHQGEVVGRASAEPRLFERVGFVFSEYRNVVGNLHSYFFLSGRRLVVALLDRG